MQSPQQQSDSVAQSTWLRMEGVNLMSFIFDTNDLSTVRGGSLLLLGAVTQAQKALEVKFKVEVISQGASAGLFRLPAGNAQRAVQVVRDVLGQGCFRHASFVVNAIEADTEKNFKQTVETLIALNRHQQMTQPALQVPSLDENVQDICSIDRIRPASKTVQKANDKVQVSEAVRSRLIYGREKKQQFYKDVLDQGKELLKTSEQAKKLEVVEKIRGWLNPLKTPSASDFAHDFESISTDSSRGILNRKMAVIYADGNSFGRHAQSAKTPEELMAWDKNIRALRSHMLASLLQPYLEEQTNSGKGPIRMETLLWGGDEIMFVVPAWTALDFVQRFFEVTQDWQYEKQALTHSIGLVLCHHNAPIRAVKDLAKHLADKAKEETNRNCNAMHCAVLESFDHIGGDWQSYLDRTYYGKVPSSDRCLISVKGKAHTQFMDWGEFYTNLQKLTQGLPKGRLYDYIQALLTSQQAQNRLTHDLPEDIKKIIDSYNNRPALLAAWSLLTDLWDYYPKPEESSTSVNANTSTNT